MPSPHPPKIKWDAADYAANSAPQLAWARELIARLKLRGDEHILDVGCGDGKITAELARAVPRGSATGIDASAQMISFARKAFPAMKIPNLQFRIVDAREIRAAIFSPSPPKKEERAGERRSMTSNSKPLTPPGQGEGELSAPLDLVFSSAALHWVDDHQAFLRGTASILKPGGRLIVSCGGKGNAHDVFLALRPEMKLKRWREFFRRMPKPYFFYAPADYEKWLPRFGFKSCRVELSPKGAVYEGREGFATWLRTTWLPYTQRVPEKVGQASSPSVSGKMPDPQNNLREEFIAAVTERYVAKHPLDADGRVHVRMVRLEIDAVRA